MFCANRYVFSTEDGALLLLKIFGHHLNHTDTRLGVLFIVEVRTQAARISELVCSAKRFPFAWRDPFPGLVIKRPVWYVNILNSSMLKMTVCS